MSRELPLTRIDLSLLLDGEGKCRMCGRSPPTGHAVECPAQFVENARCVLDYCQFGDSGASDVEGTFSAPLHSPGDLFRDAADFVVRYGGLTWIGFRVESSVPSTLSDEEIRAAIDREFPAAETRLAEENRIRQLRDLETRLANRERELEDLRGEVEALRSSRR